MVLVAKRREPVHGVTITAAAGSLVTHEPPLIAVGRGQAEDGDVALYAVELVEHVRLKRAQTLDLGHRHAALMFDRLFAGLRVDS